MGGKKGTDFSVKEVMVAPLRGARLPRRCFRTHPSAEQRFPPLRIHSQRPLPRRLLPVSTSLESQPRLADFLARSRSLGAQWSLWPSSISWFSPPDLRIAHSLEIGA